jgi:hypothetical protein
MLYETLEKRKKWIIFILYQKAIVKQNLFLHICRGMRCYELASIQPLALQNIQLVSYGVGQPWTKYL